MTSSRNHIPAKKSLGQNFLRSEKALRQIVEAAELTSTDIVLEIGPGEGALSQKILETGATLIAIEKDDRLIPYLSERFSTEMAQQRLILHHGDVLELDLDSLLHPYTGEKLLKSGQFKVVANIPYYITGLLLPLVLSGEIQPSLAVFLVQKEVANRIMARDHKESILSLSVKAYGVPTYIDKVPRGAFVPAPNVDSAIIKIANISKDFFKKTPSITEESFFTTVKQGFAHKRKLLKSNLELTEEQLQKANLPSTVRAEDLTIDQWKTLATAQ